MVRKAGLEFPVGMDLNQEKLPLGLLQDADNMVA
jgi:hypothetical protein